MMSRNGSVAGGGGRTISHMPTSIKPSIKKKPAPPRPPQPNINRLQTSMSFNTAQDLVSQTSKPRVAGKDLIDFSTPPGSPKSGRRNTVSQISTAIKDPNEFSYRVGASIFYIRSPLKHSASETPVQNPFSPPRPSAGSVATTKQKPIAPGNLQGNINAEWNSSTPATNQPTAWDTPPVASSSNNLPPSRMGAGTVHTQFQTSSSLENNNTIKSNYQTASPWIPAGAGSSSNASSDHTSNSFSDFGGSSQPRYSNVPVTGKKELTSTLSTGSGTGAKPTIIRPVNKISSQASQDGGPPSVLAGFAALNNSLKNMNKSEHGKVENDVTRGTMQRNYYDVPPDEEEEEDGDDEHNDSSFMSPPMPSEPPPPPPPDVAVDEWVSSTTSVTDYPDTYSDAGQTTAYAIALYDFAPESQGDLQLQAGDLVYLLRKIDDAWYQGSCGGMEGIFPSNFVNVMVPLPDGSVGSVEGQSQPPENEQGVFVAVLFEFAPEAETDLGLQVGETVKVLGRINEDWLYGEKDGTKGQFPSAFVQQIYEELPYIKV